MGEKMCEIGRNNRCGSCPFCYNDEYCLIEEDYIEDYKKVIELEVNYERIKINRVYKEQ